jgi:long-chain fatty acid transport protein
MFSFLNLNHTDMRKYGNLISKLSAIVFAIFLSISLSATDGYLSSGIGIQLKSLAGAGVALQTSPLHAATNPASLIFIESGYDINISIFNPNRDITIVGNPSGFPQTFGLAPGKVESSSTLFVLPAIATNWKLNNNIAFGLAFYGNGGMNTNYQSPVFGQNPTGVNLMQMFLQPTLSLKFTDKYSIGVAPILAYQIFKAEGLGAFRQFSQNAQALSDRGNSSSFGYGARIGIIGELHEMITIGASFQTPIKMGEFDEYSGLFAESGGFDIPMNWTAGVAFNLMLMEVAFDVKKIYYSDVNSIGNPMKPNIGETLLGSTEGAGFGWQDIMVYKIGINYPVNEEWTLRGGYSFGDQPIPETDVMFNILAPGVIKQHVSFGFSKIINYENELSFFVTRAFSNEVTGANPLEVPNAQTIALRMDQWEFGMGYTF